MKSFVVCCLVSGLALIAIPAEAQELLVARTLADVCLPYATRSQSLEKSISAARALHYRRPVGATEPINDWASEVDLVSNDGSMRLRIEEGTVERGETSFYAVSCEISSTRFSARELSSLGRRAFRDETRWESTQPSRWERRTPRPAERGLAAEVTEEPGSRPTLTVTGSYY